MRSGRSRTRTRTARSSSGTTSSQPGCGCTPPIARKIPTTTQLTRNVIAAAIEVESGMTSGGNEIRRIVGPLDTSDGSVALTASTRKVLSTIPISRYSGYRWIPSLKTPREDDPEDGEVRHRLRERPDVPEHRACVFQLELGTREHLHDPSVVRESLAERQRRTEVAARRSGSDDAAASSVRLGRRLLGDEAHDATPAPFRAGPATSRVVRGLPARGSRRPFNRRPDRGRRMAPSGPGSVGRVRARGSRCSHARPRVAPRRSGARARTPASAPSAPA